MKLPNMITLQGQGDLGKFQERWLVQQGLAVKNSHVVVVGFVYVFKTIMAIYTLHVFLNLSKLVQNITNKDCIKNPTYTTYMYNNKSLCK